MPHNDTMKFWKEQAASSGLEWSQVAAAYRAIRAEQHAEIDGLIELRKAIWSKFSGTAKLTYRRAFTVGDQTMIPGWDTVATAVACEFHIDQENIADYLWEIARRDKPVLPEAHETYAAAIEECLQMAMDFNPAHFTETEF